MMDIYLLFHSRKIKPGDSARMMDIGDWRFLAAFATLELAKAFVANEGSVLSVGEWEVSNNGGLHTAEAQCQARYTGRYTEAYRIAKCKVVEAVPE